MPSLGADNADGAGLTTALVTAAARAVAADPLVASVGGRVQPGVLASPSRSSWTMISANAHQ